MKIKKIEKVNINSLRELCISRNWFTNGSNKEYELLFKAARLLKEQDTENGRVAIVATMASMISRHSTITALDGYEIIDIMNALEYYCINGIYEVVEEEER